MLKYYPLIYGILRIDRKDSDLLTGTEEHYQYFRKIVIELFRKIEILTISQTFLDFLNFQET